MKNWIQNLKTAFADKAELRAELDGTIAAIKQLEFTGKVSDNLRDKLVKESQELNDKCGQYKNQATKLNDRVKCYEAEIELLKATLRKQNEADLYLLSAQIQKRIMNKETIKPNDGQVNAMVALENQRRIDRRSAFRESLRSNLSPHSPSPFNHPWQPPV